MGDFSLTEGKRRPTPDDDFCLKILPEKVYQYFPGLQLAEVLQSPEKWHEAGKVEFDRASVLKGQAYDPETHVLQCDLATNVRPQNSNPARIAWYKFGWHR